MLRRFISSFTTLLLSLPLRFFVLFFFFNDTATTEIYTLSLHDALPIFALVGLGVRRRDLARLAHQRRDLAEDRKSTRLNSSHSSISYAVFCLKKKKKHKLRFNQASTLTQHPNPTILSIKTRPSLSYY